MNNNNYYVVQAWMINDLGLRGNDLAVYAIIYGFTQADGDQWYTAGLSQLAEWTRGTKQGVLKNIARLIDLGLIEKRTRDVSGVKLCDYRASKDPCEGGIKLSLTGVLNSVERYSTQFNGGIKLSLPHNNNNNNNNTPSNTTTYNANALSSVVSSPPRGEDTENKPKKPTVADLEAEFEEVWSIYPLKAGKKRARAAYIAARRDKVPREDIEQGAKAYAEFVRESGTEQRYVKHGSTWFNGRCWEDKLAEVTERANAKPKGKTSRATNYKQHHYTVDQLKAMGIDFGLDIYADDTNETPVK